MKNIIFLLLMVSIFTNLNAQDVIIKNDGTEIESKISEVGLENIKYKKFSSLDGPTYLLPKKEIFMIKYEDGTKDVFNPKESITNNTQSSSSDFHRKGLYLGFHLIPGSFTMSFEDSDPGFGFNFGADLNVLFNDIVGIKTGFSFSTLNYKQDLYYYDEYSGQFLYFEGSEKINSIGIPIKFLLITGKKTVGFFLETGFNIYFPLSSKIEINGYKADGDLESVVLSSETSIGINIKATDLISINLALFTHYTFTSYFPNDDHYGLMTGFHTGMLFKLPK